MESLRSKLCPLPKAIYPVVLGRGRVSGIADDTGARQEEQEQRLASCTLAPGGRLLVCAVVPPTLSADQREGLLRVSRHLKHALESAEPASAGLHVQLQPTFTTPPSPSASSSSSTSSAEAEEGAREVSAVYLVLMSAASDEAAEGEPPVEAVQPHLLARAMETKAEGYTLKVDDAMGRVEITGRTCRGVFYGVQTLLQLMRAYNVPTLPSRESSESKRELRLPLVFIADQPDFAARGVMLDVSRDKVPTVDTLKMLLDELAGLKINQFQLYMEHTFAYRGHEEVWRDSSPYTVEDILELDGYCRERFIELVPNQNSFGHFHRWLKHDNYRKYAEVPEGNLHPFLAVGDEIQKEPFGLAPDDQSIQLLDELYFQLLPNFSSSQFNVGCDETFDLGQGKSKSLCEEKGVQKVYIEFLNRVNDLVAKKYRKKMLYWGDIVLQQPELINTLPKDAISLIWGYEANHPFDRECKAYAELKEFPFYVCPGTSAWNSVGGRTDNAIANLINAAKNGHTNGAVGYLITDWGDNGHWQTLPVSYLGYLVGAGLAWNAEANDQASYLSPEHVAARLNLHILRDKSNVVGKVMYDLGNLYRVTGGDKQYNATCLFRYLQTPTEESMKGIEQASAENAHDAVQGLRELLKGAQVERKDGNLILEEVMCVADMNDVSCRAMALVRRGESSEAHTEAWRDLQREWDQLRARYESLWLKRNRSGGLQDSLKRFVPFARFLASKSQQTMPAQ